MLSIFALLEPVRVGLLNLGLISGAAIAGYYFFLDVRTAAVATFGLALLYVAGLWIPWPVAIAAFVAGWIFQFVGHRFEGRNPAFVTNLIHLLIGPLWICSLVVSGKESA